MLAEGVSCAASISDFGSALKAFPASSPSVSAGSPPPTSNPPSASPTQMSHHPRHSGRCSMCPHLLRPVSWSSPSPSSPPSSTSKPSPSLLPPVTSSSPKLSHVSPSLQFQSSPLRPLPNPPQAKPSSPTTPPRPPVAARPAAPCMNAYQSQIITCMKNRRPNPACHRWRLARNEGVGTRSANRKVRNQRWSRNR